MLRIRLCTGLCEIYSYNYIWYVRKMQEERSIRSVLELCPPKITNVVEVDLETRDQNRDERKRTERTGLYSRGEMKK